VTEATTPIVLRRVDPARNMARFYRMQLQPTLFGGVTVIRECGRIGQAGTCRSDQYETAEAARSALTSVCLSKIRRGYSAPHK
jgi:predicted DNA-binding WGR domain protein